MKCIVLYISCGDLQGTEERDMMEERKSRVTRKKTKSLENEKPSSKRLDNLSLKVSMLTN